MKKKLSILIIILILLGCQNENSKKNSTVGSTVNQSSINKTMNNSALFLTIKSMDSLFFNIAYNQCDTAMGRNLISRNFEFYHDKGGVLLDTVNELASEVMIDDLAWICIGTFRKLVDNNMEVYPLYENEKLYGVIQTGDHQFFNVENNTPTDLTANAKFIHLWILENNNWKLRRVFSYDHQEVNKN